MPSPRFSYHRLNKVLHERDVINLLKRKNKLQVVFSDLKNLKKPIELRNEPLEPIFEIDTKTYHCKVCGTQVLKKFNFCPECSQSLK
jgi:rubrerythrin